MADTDDTGEPAHVVPASLSETVEEPMAHRDLLRSGDYHDIDTTEGQVTRIFRDGSYYFDSKGGQRTRYGFIPREGEREGDDPDPDLTAALLAEQVRFFRAALSVKGESTPQDIIHAAVTVLDDRPETRLLLRHVVEQGNRYDHERHRATTLHESLLYVGASVASALERFTTDDAPTPPRWLLALANAIDLVLAEAALDRRPPL